nr:sugar nucleotide-binding protein [Corynebacterium kalidii]
MSVDLLSPAPGPLPRVDAMVVTLTPGIGGPEDPHGYLTALRHLATALPDLPSRTVFVSSTGVFDRPTQDRPLTEDDAPRPVSPRAVTLADGEALARELFGAHVVRPAGIYGPGREFLLRTVRDGTPVNYRRRTNRIHETDLVRTLEVMLDAAGPPSVLHAVDGQPAELGDIVSFIADELGVEAPPQTTADEPAGTYIDGSALGRFLGGLHYPGYIQGYREMIGGGVLRGNQRSSGCASS